jgi:hypothetical protein
MSKMATGGKSMVDGPCWAGFAKTESGGLSFYWGLDC